LKGDKREWKEKREGRKELGKLLENI